MAAAVIFDVVANLPSPTAFNNRFFFYATDTTTMYVSDGSTWQTVAVGTPGGGTLTSITSTDLSVTVTNPGGPIVDLSVGATGSALTEISCNLSTDNWGGQLIEYYPAGSSGASPDGYAGSLTSVPCPIGAAGAAATVTAGALKGIPVDADPYDVTLILTVADMTGAEALLVEVDVTTTAGDTSAAMDWTTATPSVIAGTDLTWDGTSSVITTAGGVFVANLSAFANWH